MNQNLHHTLTPREVSVVQKMNCFGLATIKQQDYHTYAIVNVCGCVQDS
jgi:hypothetical protein